MESFDDAEKRYINNKLDEERRELSKNIENIERFKNLCAKKGLNLSEENFRYIYTIGIVAIYPNLLSFLNPLIKKDKEGLVGCDLLNKHFAKKSYGSGYLYDIDYMAMAHPYFRRGFFENSNYSPKFINLFWGIKNSDMDLYIAIDFNRVRINVDSTMYSEYDTWFGANFSKDIRSIPNDLSKLRPPLDIDSSHVSYIFNDVYSLDILWATKDEVKSFQAEEFKTEKVKVKVDGRDYFPVRYIHAEFDLKKGYFRHFDGAVHLYTESEYLQRRDSDFNYNSKHSHQIKSNSRKLFKMNGIIDIDTWILYTSHFFTGDPLIIEYFEGKYPEYVTDMIVRIRTSRNNLK